MGRAALAIIVAAGLVLAVAGPSAAFQCPKLIKQVNDEAGNRLDDAGFTARQLVEQAEALHKDGKHAESEAKAKEAMKALGIRPIWGASKGPPLFLAKGLCPLALPAPWCASTVFRFCGIRGVMTDDLERIRRVRAWIDDARSASSR